MRCLRCGRGRWDRAAVEIRSPRRAHGAAAILPREQHGGGMVRTMRVGGQIVVPEGSVVKVLRIEGREVTLDVSEAPSKVRHVHIEGRKRG